MANKSMYHSELVDMSQDNPVTITLLKPPADSRNKDLAGYQTFRDPDGDERYLNIENQAIRDRLAALPLDKPIQVTASGRGDAAHIEVVGQDRSQARPQQQNGPPLQQQASTPRQTVDHRNGAISNDVSEALEVARDIVERYVDKHGHEPSDAVLKLMASLHIQFERENGRRPLADGTDQIATEEQRDKLGRLADAADPDAMDEKGRRALERAAGLALDENAPAARVERATEWLEGAEVANAA